jgi:hypothetical protein
MQLGALIRLLNSTSLLNHSLEKDYQALTVEQLLKEVKVAACPTWYAHHGHPRTSRHSCPHPGNTFDLAIKSIANEVDEPLQGLRITDYVQSASESSNGAVTAESRKKRKGSKSVMKGTPS